jgi:hypothetical protein
MQNFQDAVSTDDTMRCEAAAGAAMILLARNGVLASVLRALPEWSKADDISEALKRHLPDQFVARIAQETKVHPDNFLSAFIGQLQEARCFAELDPHAAFEDNLSATNRYIASGRVDIFMRRGFGFQPYPKYPDFLSYLATLATSFWQPEAKTSLQPPNKLLPTLK